jgi:osmotically-inducible protein OsmY
MPLFWRLSAVVSAIAVLSAVGCADSPTREVSREYVSDLSITTKVKAALLEDPRVKATEVKVETFHGTVRISGFVNSGAAMNQALQMVRDVKGVTGIKNDMRIR